MKRISIFAGAIVALGGAAYACVILAAVVTGGPGAGQTAQPIEQLKHPPMGAYRNRDGSIRRLRNSIVTGYWSGYAVTASAPYTSASGTFQIPSVTNDGLSGSTEYVSQWVGIGGYSDSTLIQLGAIEYASTSGHAFYRVWYELYPAGSAGIPQSVRPGDVITASLQCTAACSPSSVQTWQLSMSDQTAGWSWTQSFQYQSTMASAEWITEAPGWPTLPLADYGQATFDPVEANGMNPNLSLSANGVIMQDSYGETSNPSAPVDGDVFSTCWGNGALTPCTAGSFTPPPPGSILLENLTNAAGVWTFGAPYSPGNWWINLNGQQIYGAGSEMVIANGGQLYALGTDNNWYLWIGSGWTLTDPPVLPAPPANPLTIPSPDGTILLASVQTSAGVWTFGAPYSPGNWWINLNGQQIYGAGSEMVVANGGQLYVLGADNNWYLWIGNGWTQTPRPAEG